MSKIFNKKDIFNVTKAEDANEYVGKEGYFAESISILERDIEQQNTSRLIGVDTTEVCCFHARNKGNYSLFLPIDKVKKPKKKWRAFKDIDEFFKYFKIGDLIHIKDEYLCFSGMFIGYQIAGVVHNVIIGNKEITINDKDLLKHFQIEIENRWQPFGVEEMSEELNEEDLDNEELDATINDLEWELRFTKEVEKIRYLKQLRTWLTELLELREKMEQKNEEL